MSGGAPVSLRTLALPWPPSANRLWRFVPGQPHPLKSTAYRKWLKAAQAELWGVRRIAGPFQIQIVAHAPDRRARDLDNLCKPVLDALKGIAFEDDKDAKRIVLEWAPSICKGGSVLVLVQPWLTPASDAQEAA